MPGPKNLPRFLIARLPFFYGWVSLASTCCAGFSRAAGGARAILSRIAPMAARFFYVPRKMRG